MTDVTLFLLAVTVLSAALCGHATHTNSLARLRLRARDRRRARQHPYPPVEMAPTHHPERRS